MKRTVVLCEEEREPLVDDVILCINTKVVAGGIVTLKELLSWHSVNKLLYKKWLDRGYLVELIEKAGKRSLELFQKERHGFYLENDRTLFLYKHIFPMVDRIFSEIINEINLKDLIKTNEYVYKSKNNLTVSQLVPVALHPVREKLISLLYRFMKYRHGWIVETKSMRQSLMDLGGIAEPNLLVSVKPVKTE